MKTIVAHEGLQRKFERLPCKHSSAGFMLRKLERLGGPEPKLLWKVYANYHFESGTEGLDI